MRVSHRRRENKARRCVRAWHRVAARRRITRACLPRAPPRERQGDARGVRRLVGDVAARRRGRRWGGAAARNAARRATRAWRAAAAALALERSSMAAADRHARETTGRSFAALSSHWARKVLTRAFVYGRQKAAARAWSGWAAEAWERRLGAWRTSSGRSRRSGSGASTRAAPNRAGARPRAGSPCRTRRPAGRGSPGGAGTGRRRRPSATPKSGSIIKRKVADVTTSSRSICARRPRP